MNKSTGEAQMVHVALRNLVGRGVQAAVEVPLLHRSIDLVFRDGHDYVAVEFKVKDWKRAFEQARDHLIAADQVYVCIPSARVSEAVIATAEEYGVGLMSFEADEPLRVVVSAHRPKYVWRKAQAWLANAFASRLPTVGTSE